MQDPQSARYDHPASYRWWVGVACVVGCFLLSLLTLACISGESSLLLRPTSGLSPALSIYFGWPAIIGCTLGSVLAEAAWGASAPVLGFMTVENLIYLTVAYLIWYGVMATSLRPYPRFDAASKIMLYIGIIIVITLFDSTASMLLNQPLGISPSIQDMLLFMIVLFNDFLFSVYLGIPLMIVLDRSRLVPLAPRWIKAPYQQQSRMPLTQKTLLLLLVVVFVIVGTVVGLTLAPELMDLISQFTEAVDYLILIDSMLLMCCIYTIGMLAISIIIMRYVETHFARPIERVANATSDFVEQVAAYQASSDAEALAPADIDTAGTKPTGEIAELIASSNQMRHDLVSYMEELERTTADTERINTELEIASSIQQGAVSHDFSSYKERFNVDIATMLRPAREVGGDFYDVFDVSDDKVGIIVADVSGKGMPAALFMMRALAEIRDQMRSRPDVGEALTLANRSLCDHNDAMLFVTVFAGVLDTNTGQFDYANAGHDAPWLRSEHSIGWLSMPPGLVMGMVDKMTYKTLTLTLAPGDALFLYTDGVAEATNADNVLFGADRMEAVLRAVWHDDPDATSIDHSDLIPASEVVDAMILKVDEFAGDEPQFDDITMMSIVWRAPA